MVKNKQSLPQTGQLKEYPDAPLMPLRSQIILGSLRNQMPWRLRLQISGESHGSIGMEVKDKILIGRADPDQNIQPDLDLTPYGGAQSGVSRRHAQIVQEDDALFVEDLESTNGTRLNSFILQPYQRYRLRDGDEIGMGKVRVVIRFIKSPSPFG
jgi:pSer/pThr/pTyr-binding forkhead associated (FHA) protein